MRKSYSDSSAFLTICGGVEVPRLAGLLEGRTATGPRFIIESMLRAQSPGVKWVERRWVRDGKLWTSGALLNGTDMMRNFAMEFWGDRKVVGMMCEMGGWPDRDVEYKDAEGVL